MNKINLACGILFSIVLAAKSHEQWFLMTAGFLYAVKTIQIYLYQSKEDK